MKFGLNPSKHTLRSCYVLASAQILYEAKTRGPRPGRGQMLKAKAEAEAKILPRGHFGLEALTSLIRTNRGVTVNNLTIPLSYEILLCTLSVPAVGLNCRLSRRVNI